MSECWTKLHLLRLFFTMLPASFLVFYTFFMKAFTVLLVDLLWRSWCFKRTSLYKYTVWQVANLYLCGTEDEKKTGSTWFFDSLTWLLSNLLRVFQIKELSSDIGKLLYMGQSIQEWTKWNLWKTAFKKFEVIWSA